MNERVLWLEPVGGIAGDMFLAAALDLGISVDALVEPLRSLQVPGWDLKVSKVERHHIFGTHVDVVVKEDEGHVHRSWKDIDALISRSKLSDVAKANALKVFRLIGEVEAQIHGTTLDEIHFHEVGAVDSIVDICGAAVVLDLLGNPRVYAAPPPLGSGTIKIAHGVVPIPVPATLALLRDLPVKFEGAGELVTPTGAALLKAFATIEAPPPSIIERVGYGAGTKDFADRANLLRMSVGRLASKSTDLTVLECNLDDCSPQLLGALVDTLIARGALDVWIAPVTMKKGRPGHLLGVLTDAQHRDVLTNTLLTESTTLGVRESSVTRTALERRHDTVQTPWGEVRVKLGLRGEAVLNAAPEFDDCRGLAARHDVPVKQVQAAAIAAWYAKQR
ncbi:MAG: nickel pincer cofactor biosynthesis protein LarC [Archangium gephyra]|uniref:Putative nickel insertion protein n=1 Tax=Archangium gephyra TaxID=48 RepID=A0A2W5SZ96_9BACT|nr:MAG: nickel pincer cofactor biosynthesis protein LarC [Archangium gephyra]